MLSHNPSAHTSEEGMVKSKLLYGGDIWWTGKKDIGKLETVQNEFIRWISVFQRKDKVSVSNLRKEMHIKSIEDSLCIKRLMWLGKLTRMDGNRLVSRVWGAECHGQRASRGGGKGRIIIKWKDLAKAGVSWVDALKKVKWKRAISKLGDVEISDPVDTHTASIIIMYLKTRVSA
jgi:hypothetical protein